MNGDERFQQYMAMQQKAREALELQKFMQQYGYGGGEGGSGSASALKFAPGQSVIMTPDPTVNGPWTHTDASIPLFKAPPPAPKTPVPGGGPNPIRKETPRPRPVERSGGMYPPARKGGGMYPPAGSREIRPTEPRAPSPVPTGLRDTNWTQTASALSPTRRRRTARDVLADILSGER